MTLFQGDKAKWIQCVLFCLLSVLAYWLIGYLFVRTQSGELILSFGVLFLIYGLIISQKWNELWVRRWLWIALGFRLLFLLGIPVLSDDYFRFIWDGRLLAAGYNPYLYLPSALIDSSIAADAQLDRVLFEGMNSPHYFYCVSPIESDDVWNGCLARRREYVSNGYFAAQFYSFGRSRYFLDDNSFCQISKFCPLIKKKEVNLP